MSLDQPLLVVEPLELLQGLDQLGDSGEVLDLMGNLGARMLGDKELLRNRAKYRRTSHPVAETYYPGRKDGQLRARSSGHVASFVTGL
jgi:hypothetical protein